MITRKTYLQNWVRAIAISLVATLPATALAELSFYGGVGAGGSRVEEDANITLTASVYDENDVLVPIESATLDKFNGTDVGYRIFGGVRVLTFLAIEAGYVDLGKPDDSLGLIIPTGGQLGPETDVALKLTDEIDGFEYYLVGMLPISDNWEFIAKIGAITWDSTFTTRNAFADVYPPSGPDDSPFIPTVTPPSSSQDTDGTDLAGGIGMNYKVTENTTLRGEGTWYDIDDTEQVWLLNISAIYNF